jgi:hypothetical protein
LAVTDIITEFSPVLAWAFGGMIGVLFIATLASWFRGRISLQRLVNEDVVNIRTDEVAAKTATQTGTKKNAIATILEWLANDPKQRPL